MRTPVTLARATEERAMEVWELAAREQIRDTIARYAHCVDGGRFDDLVELFVPVAVL